jgi:hypothetical protein
MIATSPKTRIITSLASRFLIVTDFAVCARKALRSTSDPSGLLQ